MCSPNCKPILIIALLCYHATLIRVHFADIEHFIIMVKLDSGILALKLICSSAVLSPESSCPIYNVCNHLTKVANLDGLLTTNRK